MKNMEFVKLMANLSELQKLMPIIQFVIINKDNKNSEISELLI